MSRLRQRSWPLRNRGSHCTSFFTVTIIHFYTSIVRNTIALCGQGFKHSNRAMPPHWDTMPALKQNKNKKKKLVKLFAWNHANIFTPKWLLFFSKLLKFMSRLSLFYSPNVYFMCLTKGPRGRQFMAICNAINTVKLH